jgi:hypothetical protein
LLIPSPRRYGASLFGIHFFQSPPPVGPRWVEREKEEEEETEKEKE